MSNVTLHPVCRKSEMARVYAKRFRIKNPSYYQNYRRRWKEKLLDYYARYRAKKRASIRAYDAAYRSDPLNKAKHALAQRKYYRRNREEIRERRKK